MPEATPTAPERTYSIGGVVLVVGAVIAAIGSVLPWATVTAPFVGTISKAGTDGDGVITIILAVVMGIFGLVAWRPVSHGASAAWGAIAAIAIGGIAIYDIANVSDAIKTAEAQSTGLIEIDASVGTGLWITAAGAAVGLVGALMKNSENSAAWQSSEPAPAPDATTDDQT